MGITTDNVEYSLKTGIAKILSHRKIGEENDYLFYVGGAVSPWFDQNRHAAMKVYARNSFHAFDAAAELIVGSGFWNARTVAEKTALFDWYAGNAGGRLKFRLHRGDQNIDRRSQFASPNQTDTLFADAAVSFAAFDASAAVVWGSVWSADPPMTLSRRQAFRNAAAAF